ncbi:hypothetical protein ILUMI_10218 [Ignelater luminosus]|uniref:Uncharacterized protein n=1 Tax=Ignelater luminosus TaxID=2038154 RepID=A0A8K0CYB6_IGNLU|nr:hypothetical protein ILUMI_10218 [Ignelater luminosus]
MKCLIVCFTLLVGALAYSWEPHELKCIEELGTDKSIVEGFGDPLEKPTPIDNEAYNEFTECSWKKQGLVTDAGEVNWDAIDNVILEAVKEDAEKNKSDSEEQVAALLAGGLIKGLIDNCRNEHGNSNAQTFVKVQNCIGTQLRTLDSSEEKH